MGLPFFILAITNVVNVALLVFVLRKHERGSGRLLHAVFAGSIVFLVLWSTSNYLADTSSSMESALFWTRASFPPALFMCWFVFFFASIFPTRRKRMVFVYGYFVGACVLSFLSMGSGVIREVTIDPAIGISGVVVGSFYTATVALYLLLILHATYIFVSNYRRHTGKQKTQVRLALIGWSVFLLFAVTTNAILPLITGNANWSKFGPLGSVVMVVCISYAIVRHGFMDIKVIIQRGLVYSILFSVITGIYVVLLFISQYLFHKSSNTSVIVSAFVTTVVGIYGFEPLKQFFKRVTAPIFFKDAYDYADVLGQLADVLNRNIVHDSIIKKTSEILEHSLKSHRVVFYLKPDICDERGDEYALVVPIRSNKKSIGVLCVAEKRSGDPYTAEDVHLLETFCSQAAVALEKAALYRQVKEHAETLEVKVEERTSEIAKIQKEQESMMLEISHGLQTPLTIMKGELSLLRKKGYEMEKLDVMDSSIDRISTFIYKLLGMYRLETTIMSLPASVSLREIIDTVVASFGDSVREDTVSIRSDIPHDVIVVGDKEGLEEVLSNLVGNAIKYSAKDRKNEIKVTLSLNGQNAVITVRDTGIGISKEHIQNLFKKFFRVKDGDTKGIHGTGLGLAIAKKIVEMHGGVLTVESEYGTGTTMTVTLPQK